MTPSSMLLQRLSRSKLLPRWALATVGVGERRSKSKGAGFEFADHRKYEIGDDLRYLDLHIQARLGENFIRQYEVHRQLPITILIDSSQSMEVGEPQRLSVALRLASILSFVGLAGGDQVQLGIVSGDRIEWSSRIHGASRAQVIFEWLGRKHAQGGSFAAAMRAAARHVTDRGLFIAISDWWDEGVGDLLPLAASGQEIWGLHLVTPDEMDPAVLGQGEAQLVDAETGLEVEITVDRGTIERYRRAFEAWQDQLRQKFSKVRGRYMVIPTTRPLEELVLRDWRREGVVS